MIHLRALETRVQSGVTDAQQHIQNHQHNENTQTQMRFALTFTTTVRTQTRSPGSPM